MLDRAAHVEPRGSVYTPTASLMSERRYGLGA
jgi:hypothetical protein